MLRFEPIKKKRAQIRILCAASATRSRSVDEEQKKSEGRRKKCLFGALHLAEGALRT